MTELASGFEVTQAAGRASVFSISAHFFDFTIVV
jgi:hypothetical protein